MPPIRGESAALHQGRRSEARSPDNLDRLLALLTQARHVACVPAMGAEEAEARYRALLAAVWPDRASTSRYRVRSQRQQESR
jgi:hypothetical protein